MERLIFVYVVFAYALVLVDCKYKRENQCEALAECQALVENVVPHEDGLPNYAALSDEGALDQFCENVTTASSCVAEKRPGCSSPSVLQRVDSVESAVAFICSEEGRQETLEVAQSVCTSDESIQLEVNEGVDTCAERFEFDVLHLTVGAVNEHRQLEKSDLCLFFEEWVDCTVTVATNKCGEAYGRFLKRILTASTGQFEDLDCTESLNKKRELMGSVMERRRFRR